MKKVFLILSVSVFLTSCYTSNQFVGNGGNHIRRGLDSREHRVSNRVRPRDVEIIRSAHGNYGNIFHRREQPCSDQW
jgi:hypothetical protein